HRVSRETRTDSPAAQETKEHEIKLERSRILTADLQFQRSTGERTRMNCSSQSDARGCRIDTTRRGIPSFRLDIVTLIASFMLGGCSTHLGYVPYDVYAPNFWPNANVVTPTYPQVKTWGFKV